MQQSWLELKDLKQCKRQSGQYASPLVHSKINAPCGCLLERQTRCRLFFVDATALVSVKEIFIVVLVPLPLVEQTPDDDSHAKEDEA